MLHFQLDMPLHLMALYGSVMIVLVLLLRCFLRNKLPKFVFPALWSVVLLRLLIPFSLSSPISAPVPNLTLPNTVVLSSPNAVSPNTAQFSGVTTTSGTNIIYSTAEYSGFDWQCALFSLMLLGAILTAAILLCQKYRYNRVLKNSLLIEHNETINAILRQMGMGHVLVFTCDGIASPLVCGMANPRIYLPTALDFCNTELLQHILAHETMHIRRKDNWIKGALFVALCLHWYNPLVWMLSKYLSADLEAACDAAVLAQLEGDQRQNYACSLLSMAITGNRSTLLYSAFSKIEVERRIQTVLQYKRATAGILVLSLVFLLGSTAVFATGGQAPFSDYLSSYCSSANNRWGIKASLTRDIALGKDAQKRADTVILEVLRTDKTGNPAALKELVQAALSTEFSVEKRAFAIEASLNLSDAEKAEEYAKFGITKTADGFHRYQGEPIRTYTDALLHTYQSVVSGTVDITINRNELGYITTVTAQRKGDKDFDKRTEELERTSHVFSDVEVAANSSNVVIEDKPITRKP